jgi:hypothetical protein
MADPEPTAQVVQEIIVKRKVGLAHIGPAIEINELGEKVKDIYAEIWISDPSSETTNYSGTRTPESLKFCEGCTFGTYTPIDMGFGSHRIEFTRTGTYSHGDDEEYNYYKECLWDINIEMGTEFPQKGYENECGIEEGGLFIPRLERKAPPIYELSGTIESWKIPPEIFVRDEYDYLFRVKNTSTCDVDTLEVQYRVTLEYRSIDLVPEKTYSKKGSWKWIMIGSTSDLVVTYAIPLSAVPSDMVYVTYDIYAILELDTNNVRW